MMRFAIFGALLVLSPSSAFASVPMGGLAQQRLHIGSDPLVAVQTDLGVEDSEPEESRGVGVSTLSSVVSVVGPVPELEPAVTTPPSGLNTGGSLAISAILASLRGGIKARIAVPVERHLYRWKDSRCSGENS